MTLQDKIQEHLGILYGCLFGFTMAVQVNLTKLLLSQIHVSCITFFRCVAFVFTLPLIEWNDANSLTSSDLTFYLLVSVIGVLPYCFTGECLVFMEVGDATAIDFGLGLIFTALIAHIFLYESLDVFNTLYLIGGCVGIVLVAKPSFVFDHDNVTFGSREMGTVVAVISAFFNSVWCILMRQLVHRNTMLCFLGIFLHGMAGMIMSGVWTTFESAWKIPHTWSLTLITIGYGLVNVLHIVAEFRALENSEAKDVALMATTSVVFSYIAQIAFFGEETDLICVAGAIIIIICVLCSAFKVRT